jgi:lipocalin
MLRFFAALLAIGASSNAFAVNLDGIKNFQPNQYLGTWYQIQSTNPFFQRDCKCAKADYARIDDTTLSVINTCVKANGEIRTAKGTAKITNPAKPAQLAVRLSPFAFGGPNYIVTEVGTDYEYSVVVSPGNAPIWILSRTKTLPSSVLSGIHLRLIEAGVRIADLKDTDPNQCQDF